MKQVQLTATSGVSLTKGTGGNLGFSDNDLASFDVNYVRH
jgi:hypothetical protein